MESAEETVEEFLEVTTERTNCELSPQNQIHEEDTTITANNWIETDGYDSDH